MSSIASLFRGGWRRWFWAIPLVIGLASLALPTLTRIADAASADSQRSPALASVELAKPAKLPPLDLSGMRLWHYHGKWHASEWNNASSFTPWKHAHVAPQKNGDVFFRLDSQGAPELKAQTRIAEASSGLWEVDATLPTLRPGLVVAPLWLYSGKNADEIDFEFVGKYGLDISLHSYAGGSHLQKTVRLFSGTDFSGRRIRFGIALDQAAKQVEFYLDGKKVLSLTSAEVGFFPSSPLKPLMSMWPTRPDSANLVSWTGRWQPLSRSETLTMTVHGYGYRALGK